MARGKYIARMDGDDIMLPHRLEKQVNVMDENPDITVCSSWYECFGLYSTVSKRNSGEIPHLLLRLLRENILAHPTTMIRKSFIENKKIFYKEYLYAEDYKLWSDIAIAGGLFYVIPEVLLKYRCSASQISYLKHEEQIETTFLIKSEILEYLISQYANQDKNLMPLYNSLTAFNEKEELSSDSIFHLFSEIFEFKVKQHKQTDKNTYLEEKLTKSKQLSIIDANQELKELDDKLQPKKIGIVILLGGLGNQMFQYAFYLYLKKKIGSQINLYIDPTGYDQLLNTFEVDNSTIVSEYLRKQIAQINTDQKSYVTEECTSCIQQFNIPSTAITIYNGYWQCADYVEESKTEIEKTFKLWKRPLNEKNQSLLNQIKSTCSVSIHIRRGDYLSPLSKEMYGGICTMNYYAKAMRKMKDLLMEEPTFYLFTNDPEWVQNHFKYKKCVLVVGNQGKDDWQDLVLMSACQHHIIANSSFSWWGAKLGRNPQKKVIAPSWWYKGMPTPDLLPPSWIRISIDEPKLKDLFAAHLIFGNISPCVNMPYLGELTLSFYYFSLFQISHKSIYRKIAEEKLDYICSNIVEIQSISEFISVSRGIVYLYNKKYITGNSASIFNEIDAYLWEKLNNADDCSIKNCLTDIAGYFVSRIVSSQKGTERSRQKLIKMLDQTILLIWNNKTMLSNKNKEALMTLGLKMIEMQIFQADYIPLFMYCSNDYSIVNWQESLNDY